MEPEAAVAEAWRMARAQRLTSVLVALLCAAACTAVLLTVGGTAAAEAAVLGRLDDAGARRLVVTDVAGSGLVTATALDVLNKIDTVERAVGLDRPLDVTNGVIGHGGAAVPLWRVSGPLDAAVTLSVGRWPRAGEGLVAMGAQHRLGVDQPFGVLLSRDSNEFAVVGGYVARAPFEFLDAGAVVSADPNGPTVASAHVVITAAAASSVTERLVVATLGPTDLKDISVESPTGLADLHRVVGGDLSSYGRGLLLVTLGVAGFLVGVVVLTDVLLRRRDLGRRRALGASRKALVALVVLRTAIVALPGALAGVGIGTFATLVWAHVPPWDFMLGAAVLATLAATIASAIPAVVAAWRDPVAVLRTP